MLQGMTADDLIEILGTMTSGGNTMKTRFVNIMAATLKNECAMKSELQLQIKHVESLLANTIELAITQEFADAHGSISWMNLTKKMGKLMRGEAMDE